MISLITKTEKEQMEEETLSNMSEYDKTVPISGGFTRYELQEAFNLVANKSDWKDPTRTKIKYQTLIDNKKVIEEAVIFFTGSCAEFYYTGTKRKTYWVAFDGYYLAMGDC